MQFACTSSKCIASSFPLNRPEPKATQCHGIRAQPHLGRSFFKLSNTTLHQKTKTLSTARTVSVQRSSSNFFHHIFTNTLTHHHRGSVAFFLKNWKTLARLKETREQIFPRDASPTVGGVLKLRLNFIINSIFNLWVFRRRLAPSLKCHNYEICTKLATLFTSKILI